MFDYLTTKTNVLRYASHSGLLLLGDQLGGFREQDYFAMIMPASNRQHHWPILDKIHKESSAPTFQNLQWYI